MEATPLTEKNRPWWIFTTQMPLLDTTLSENHQPPLKHFIVEGVPVIKSLHWIMYGPLLAVMTVAGMTGLAWLLNIKSQSNEMKLAFACMWGVTPILVWVAGGWIIGKLGQKYLARRREAGRRRVDLRLDLTARTLQINRQPPLHFEDLGEFKLITDNGVYYNPQESIAALLNLAVDTTAGQITILPKDLGNVKQKLQLQSQLNALTQR